MSDQDTIDRLQAQGVDVTTVGEIMGDRGEARPTPARLVPPMLEGTPTLPEPGIYFGMSDSEYHALPALSNSGIKKLAASPMIFWANTPWLSPRKQQEVAESAGEEKAHHVFGKAYHCRIMEGREAFASRFAVELDPGDFPDALVSSDQIKAAIGAHTAMQPVKVASARKADMEAQLFALNQGREPMPGNVNDLKAAITAFQEPAPVKPWRKVPDALPDGTPYERDAVKADWIRQLLELDSEAQIFDVLAAQHREAHPGKTLLTADQFAELEIAATMVERDPECKDAFKGGHAEVVLIWYCPTTGVPMKARVDYLKVKAMVDLKSIGNQRERSIENAIRWEIASYHYNIQPAVYFEGAKEVRQLIRDHGASVIHVCDEEGDETPRVCNLTAWAMKWAQHSKPDEWLWVFQQKGNAPITRGVWFPRGVVLMVTNDIVLSAKRKFREFAEGFGLEPWLDVKPIYTIADEEIPISATEI